jgi:hypothetical protein
MLIEMPIRNPQFFPRASVVHLVFNPTEKTMRSHLSIGQVLRSSLLLPALFLLAGCTGDLQQLQQARDEAAATLSAAQAAAAQVQQQLTTRPADDPARQALQPELQQIEGIISQVQAYLPTINAAIQSASSGQVDPTVQQAAAAIPYGSLALALISVIVAVVKHVQAGNLTQEQQQTQKAFEQIVSALDAAIPTPTPEQQAKVNAVLDTDVKAKVAAVRA